MTVHRFPDLFHQLPPYQTGTESICSGMQIVLAQLGKANDMPAINSRPSNRNRLSKAIQGMHEQRSEF